jgi:heme-degrading monooxygenase HmoA
MVARVMVFANIREGEEDQFIEAYKGVTAKVKGTPGHIRDELLRQEGEPTKFILLSEWESKEAFLGWEDDPVHMNTTTPMRPYWSGRVERNIYEVAHRLES